MSFSGFRPHRIKIGKYGAISVRFTAPIRNTNSSQFPFEVNARVLTPGMQTKSTSGCCN